MIPWDSSENVRIYTRWGTGDLPDYCMLSCKYDSTYYKLKNRHARNNIIMVIVEIQVTSFLMLGTRIKDGILIFFGNDVDLVVGEICLKLFDFVHATGSEGNARFSCSSYANCVSMDRRWSTMLLYWLSLSILALATTRALAKHNSSLFWMRIIDPFLAKCFSKLISLRFVPLPPWGISTWITFPCRFRHIYNLF